MRTKLTALLVVLSVMTAQAQMYTGMSGLINVPSAEMFESGEVHIGGYFMNKHFLPGSESKKNGFKYNGSPYNTFDFYASITPFRWMQIGYTFTLMKTLAEGHDKPKFNQKDRYISLKFNPFREGKWMPAIAIGANDFLSSATKRHNGSGEDAGYFCNYYLVATKHFDVHGSEIGVNLAYRYAPNDYSSKWTGVVGGITWRPRWKPDLRAIAEWTGNEINIGADVLLWKHMFIQAALVKCKYFTGGLSYRVNLF